MEIIRYFATDRYAVYIWGSYGLTFMLMAIEIVMLLKRKRNLARRAPQKTEARDSGFQTSFQESQ
ncbi:MAG TPA: heme exporter protein CcmD [Pyrinomonadaceae bacterium]|nr:heme exporter protein CcmD [Pyrinomonadaceae bacterium]